LAIWHFSQTVKQVKQNIQSTAKICSTSIKNTADKKHERGSSKHKQITICVVKTIKREKSRPIRSKAPHSKPYHTDFKDYFIL